MPTGERDGVSVAVSKAIDAVVGSYHPRTIGVLCTAFRVTDNGLRFL